MYRFWGLETSDLPCTAWARETSRILEVRDVNTIALRGCLEEDQSEGEEGIHNHAVDFYT